MRVNTFSICDPEGSPIGAALYDKLCFFNHSCVPNCVVTFSGIYARVRTLHQIPAGHELLISYIDTCQPQIKRRHQLFQQYKFNCECIRCRQEVDADPLTLMKCPISKCQQVLEYTLSNPEDDSSIFMRTSCKYGHVRTGDEQIAASPWYTQVTHLISDSQDNITSRSTEGLNEKIAALEHYLHPSNYIMHSLYNLAMDVTISEQHFHEAIPYGEKALKIYEVLNNPVDPLRGVQLLRLAKLYSLLGHIQPFTETIQAAARILHTTHGEDSIVYQQVLALY